LIKEDLVRSFVLGFGKSIILWLLDIESRSGYELISEIRRMTGVELGPGLIYPFLHLLEEKDYVTGKWVQKTGRRVKQYRLTTKGRALLEKGKELLKSPVREVFLDLIKCPSHDSF
jgi:DNA-binding PadR family transcriptional regulator